MRGNLLSPTKCSGTIRGKGVSLAYPGVSR